MLLPGLRASGVFDHARHPANNIPTTWFDQPGSGAAAGIGDTHRGLPARQAGRMCRCVQAVGPRVP